jgi:hypothetical protein
MDKHQRKYFCERIATIYNQKKNDLDDEYFKDIKKCGVTYGDLDNLKKELAKSGKVKPTRRRFYIFKIDISKIEFIKDYSFKNGWYKYDKYFDFDEEALKDQVLDTNRIYLAQREVFREACIPYQEEATRQQDIIMSFESGIECPRLLAQFEDFCKTDA